MPTHAMLPAIYARITEKLCVLKDSLEYAKVKTCMYYFTGLKELCYTRIENDRKLHLSLASPLLGVARFLVYVHMKH